MQTGISIGIKDGKIIVIDSVLTGTGTITLDGTGKFLIPGLFDCHVHIGDFEKEFPRYIHYGITSILITGGSLCSHEFYERLRNRGNQDTIPAPLVFHTSQHFSMEGRHPAKTYASDNWRDGVSIFFLKDTLQIEKLVAEVSQYPITGIKLTIEDGPNPPFVERMPQEFINKVVKEAAKYDLEVFAHVSDNIELEMAIQGGVQNLVHYTGVDIDPDDSSHIHLLAQLKSREPSWVTTLMIDKSFLYPLYQHWFDQEKLLPVYQKMKADISEKQIERAKMYRSMMKEQYGVEEDDFSAIMNPQIADIKFLFDQGINMVLGTDVGNDFIFPGYSLHEEMQILEKGGMPRLDIIKMGTLNAARMVHASDSLGSIEAGKIANLILLDENPLESIENTLAIHKVIKNGVIQERIIR